MSSTGGDIGLPGHFTSQHDEGAATLCVEPKPMAKTFFARGAKRHPFFPDPYIRATVPNRDGLKKCRKVTRKNQLG